MEIVFRALYLSIQRTMNIDLQSEVNCLSSVLIVPLHSLHISTKV